ALAARPRGDAGPLADADRRADRHQPEEAHDRRVAHPDAAVRDPAGENPRLVRPVNPDETAAEPIREHRRSRVQPEGTRPVRRGVVAGELLADVELAARRGPLRLADADARPE